MMVMRHLFLPHRDSHFAQFKYGKAPSKGVILNTSAKEPEISATLTANQQAERPPLLLGDQREYQHNAILIGQTIQATYITEHQVSL